jgi:hypothetical protein
MLSQEFLRNLGCHTPSEYGFIDDVRCRRGYRLLYLSQKKTVGAHRTTAARCGSNIQQLFHITVHVPTRECIHEPQHRLHIMTSNAGRSEHVLGGIVTKAINGKWHHRIGHHND